MMKLMKKMQLFLSTISYLTFLGSQFRQISRYLGFPEGSFKLFLAHSLPFFFLISAPVWKKGRISQQKFLFRGYGVKLPPEKR